MFTPSVKASQVTFGVEIECALPSEHIADFTPGGYHHGIQISIAPRGWNCQKDASVRGAAGFTPVEIVSGILTGEPGLCEVVAMLDYLTEIGAHINQSCGLHVHIGTAGLTPVQVARTIKLFKHYEMAFFDLNGQTARARIENSYCKPSNRWTGDRYASLNLQHVHQGHLEIRVWSGALKAEVVVAAIYMAVSLVSRATAEQPVPTSQLNTTSPIQMMSEFIENFVQGDCMIVPDVTPEDIYAVMTEQAASSNRMGA